MDSSSNILRREQIQRIEQGMGRGVRSNSDSCCKLNNTTDAIRNYVTQSTRQVEFCIEEMLKFKAHSARIIPVISYLSDNVSLDRITYEASE